MLDLEYLFCSLTTGGRSVNEPGAHILTPTLSRIWNGNHLGGCTDSV